MTRFPDLRQQLQRPVPELNERAWWSYLTLPIAILGAACVAAFGAWFLTLP